jgi:hypothetical protein
VLRRKTVRAGSPRLASAAVRGARRQEATGSKEEISNPAKSISNSRQFRARCRGIRVIEITGDGFGHSEVLHFGRVKQAGRAEGEGGRVWDGSTKVPRSCIRTGHYSTDGCNDQPSELLLVSRCLF